MRTAQQVFDTVSRHLLTQNSRCAITNNVGTVLCQYRGTDGKTCAVGCLIDPAIPTNDVEGMPVRHIAVDNPDYMHTHMDVDPTDEILLELMTDLQAVHDTTAPGEWLDALEQIAESYQLVLKPQTE